MHKAEDKQHALLLALILMINTIIIIIIAYNRTSNTVKETVIKNENDFYQNELFDLFYEQSSPDYSSDIIDDQLPIVLDDSTVESNHVNDEYMSSEFVDQEAMIPDENNQPSQIY